MITLAVYHYRVVINKTICNFETEIFKQLHSYALNVTPGYFPFDRDNVTKDIEQDCRFSFNRWDTWEEGEILFEINNTFVNNFPNQVYKEIKNQYSNIKVGNTGWFEGGYGDRFINHKYWHESVFTPTADNIILFYPYKVIDVSGKKVQFEKFPLIKK